MSSVPHPVAAAVPDQVPTPRHYLGDLYLFDWTKLDVRLPAISASAVLACLLVAIAVGHPGAALLAGGGAFTVGFGANQRIADSRIRPMLLAIFAMGTATLWGTLVGHNGYALILAAAVSAAIYGVLTILDTGLSWVGQQASVTLFVASAFPMPMRPALQRAGLIMLGGAVQMVVTSVGLRLVPELGRRLVEIPRSLYDTLYARRRELLHRVHELPKALRATDRSMAAIYATRLTVTVALASELYHRLGIQSGYWVPMTALLVQKPAFFETLSRALARVAGTLTGAVIATILAAHVPLGPWWLAVLITLFALLCYSTNGVNYALFSVCITSYIVFLLALNQLPGPEIAHRRALCTIAGALIALLIHVDALRRFRRESLRE